MIVRHPLRLVFILLMIVSLSQSRVIEETRMTRDLIVDYVIKLLKKALCEMSNSVRHQYT